MKQKFTFSKLDGFKPQSLCCCKVVRARNKATGEECLVIRGNEEVLYFNKDNSVSWSKYSYFSEAYQYKPLEQDEQITLEFTGGF